MEKETKYINLWELQTYPEKFLLAKMDIESVLPDEEKKPLAEFIESIGLNSVYMNCGEMVPYAIVDGKESKYVMYFQMQAINETEEQKTKKEKTFESFKKRLEKMDYDNSSLTKKSTAELISNYDNVVENGEYFVIGNDFYE